MLPIFLFIFFLFQSSFANLEESYHETPDSYSYYPDDMDSDDNEIEKPNNHFLRLARSDGNFDEYDDEDGPIIGKKNLKNDHFIRFGRSSHDRCLRLGRDLEKRTHDKGFHLRFGRSIQEKPRSKRQATPDKVPKRTDAYLRFGKSSNFMRFGRNHQTTPLSHNNADERLVLVNSAAIDHLPPRSFEELKVPANSPLALLLAQLMARRQEQGQRWETFL
nr:FMRFamide-related neuropeptides [Leptinotarsa decemlineata]